MKRLLFCAPVLALVQAFSSSRHDKAHISRNRLFLSSMDGMEDPLEGTTLVGKFGTSTIQKVEDAIEYEMGVIASVATIQTISAYMREFHDDVTCDWMNGFDNYKAVGFENGWNKYLENMIVLDAFEIDVLYKPPKRLSTKGSKPDGKNVMLQYTIEMQPRKIAHQFVTVRENLCTEMIEDVRSVKLENKEAITFAQNVHNHGRVYAESHRHSTGVSDFGGSTPLRNKNYNSLAVLLTNLALDLVKMDLKTHGDEATIKFLDELLEKMEGEVNKLSATERHIRQRLYASGPRALIEELYYIGISQGLDKKSGTNFMKLAESVLSTRLALSVVVTKTLEAQNSNSRKYFKMIKDHGGFNRFNLKGNQKMTIVDLDERAAKEAAEAALNPTPATPVLAQSIPSMGSEGGEEGSEVGRAAEEALPVSMGVTETAGEEEEGDFWGKESSLGGFGPMSM